MCLTCRPPSTDGLLGQWPSPVPSASPLCAPCLWFDVHVLIGCSWVSLAVTPLQPPPRGLGSLTRLVRIPSPCLGGGAWLTGHDAGMSCPLVSHGPQDGASVAELGAGSAARWRDATSGVCAGNVSRGWGRWLQGPWDSPLVRIRGTMPQAFALKWVNAFAHLSGGGGKWASRRGNPSLWHTPLCGRSDGDVCDDSASQSQVRTTQLK